MKQKRFIVYEGSGNNDIIIYDENNNKIDIKIHERKEQSLVKQHIKPDDVVLELGARYGSVSCTINKILTNKKNQVSVEPDERVWKALLKNRKRNNCKFHIFNGFISNKKLSLTNKDSFYGYGTTMISDENSTIPHISLRKLIKKYKLNFNVLIVDCEGCFESFIDENLSFLDNLRLIIYESDYPQKCDYNKIKNILLNKKFTNIDIWGNQHVWIKK